MSRPSRRFAAGIPMLPPLRRLRARASAPPLPPWTFGRSREILSVLRVLTGLSKGDLILMPTSISWEALSPVMASSLTIEFYGLDDGLSPELGHLETVWTNTGKRARAVYVVHYFGLPIKNMSAFESR